MVKKNNAWKRRRQAKRNHKLKIKHKVRRHQRLHTGKVQKARRDADFLIYYLGLQFD